MGETALMGAKNYTKGSNIIILASKLIPFADYCLTSQNFPPIFSL